MATFFNQSQPSGPTPRQYADAVAVIIDKYRTDHSIHSTKQLTVVEVETLIGELRQTIYDHEEL